MKTKLMIICPVCGRHKFLFSRGWCQACYNRNNNKDRPEFVAPIDGLKEICDGVNWKERWLTKEVRDRLESR